MMMDWILRIIGLCVLGTGVVYWLRPDLMKFMISFWKLGRRMYAAAGLRLLVGWILLSGAAYTRVPAVVVALGILTFLGGILLLVLGPQRMKILLRDWEDEASPLLLRVVASLIFLYGFLLLFSI